MSKKLLLADDSITIQKVIQITFAHEDYDLTITDNGDTAPVSYTHLTLPTRCHRCRSRWAPEH